MKFKILRSRFLDGLKYVQNIVGAKGSMQILQNVLIKAYDGKILLTTTDLSITVSCEIECDVSESGETTLPVKYLFNSILKSAEVDIDVEVDLNEQAVIHAGRSCFRLNGRPANEFPALDKEEECKKFKLSNAELNEMIRKTVYATSQDDTRRTLRGLLFRFKDMKLTVVATDGRRLAMVEREIEIPGGNEVDVVLPSKTVQELQRLLNESGEVTLSIERKRICFETGKIKIYSKLIEDMYPNYMQVIPESCSEKIMVNRIDLINAIERASILTLDEIHSIKLTFFENLLTVSSLSSEIGEAKDEVPVKYAGEKIEITFNPNFVMEPLKAIDDNEISINLNNGHSPAVIRCSIPFLYVLMPLRIN